MVESSHFPPLSPGESGEALSDAHQRHAQSSSSEPNAPAAEARPSRIAVPFLNSIPPARPSPTRAGGHPEAPAMAPEPGCVNGTCWWPKLRGLGSAAVNPRKLSAHQRPLKAGRLFLLWCVLLRLYGALLRGDRRAARWMAGPA